jgi:uncharacterized damage-inducible protein DinB
MPRINWFDRSFGPETEPDVYPAVIERLHGLLPRVEEKLRTVPASTLTQRPGGTWSVLENAGHLADLEPLWEGRLDDFLAGEPTLRAADLTNARTHEAGHNERPVADVVSELRERREHFVHRLSGLEPAAFALESNHPRLGAPMRLLDLMLFVAEHDDHHLLRISEILS